MFISTLSVYPDNSHPGADESDGLTPLPAGLDPYAVSPEDARKYYGALKTQSEKEVAEAVPGDPHRSSGPGLIVGPLDKSDRFTYWPVRIDKGGEVLAPGNARRSRADHRLARPRRVDDPHGGSTRVRHVQRHGPGEAAAR